MRAARRRDPEATRLAILDAAEAIFVEKGFAAASMSDIAARAVVTKSLIHHHFGSKEELWVEVKRRSVEEYAKAQRAIMTSAAADRRASPSRCASTSGSSSATRTSCGSRPG